MKIPRAFLLQRFENSDSDFAQGLRRLARSNELPAAIDLKAFKTLLRGFSQDAMSEADDGLVGAITSSLSQTQKGYEAGHPPADVVSAFLAAAAASSRETRPGSVTSDPLSATSETGEAGAPIKYSPPPTRDELNGVTHGSIENPPRSQTLKTAYDLLHTTLVSSTESRRFDLRALERRAQSIGFTDARFSRNGSVEDLKRLLDGGHGVILKMRTSGAVGPDRDILGDVLAFGVDALSGEEEVWHHNDGRPEPRSLARFLELWDRGGREYLDLGRMDGVTENWKALEKPQPVNPWSPFGGLGWWL